MKSRRKWTTAALLLPVVLLGLMMKVYSGPLHYWFNNFGAGVLYEIAWILFFFLLFSGSRAVHRIPFFVFLSTVVLEFLQLWHPVFLDKVRATFTGHALIGNTFSWMDFPHYLFGSLLGWLLIRRISRMKRVQ